MSMDPVTILIVDDNPEDRYSYRRMLATVSKEGYAIKEAEDADQGLAILRSDTIDCVLLDFNLPDMDGLSFLEALDDHDSVLSTPIIFLTGQGDETIAVQAMKSGAADYLIKGDLTAELLGRAIRHAVATRDARRALTEQNVLLNTLLETIPNPIFYRDREGRYLGCNKAFEAFLGKTKEEIVGKRAREVLRPPPTREMIESENAVLFSKEKQGLEAALYNCDNELRDVIVSKACFVDAVGEVKGVVGVLVDITERKQMEAALRKATEELQANVSKLETANRKIVDQQQAVIEEERLKVLLQMAGATAHELNQPLVALMGYIDLFAFDRDDPVMVASHLDKIKEAGHRIAEIVKKIQSIRPDQAQPAKAGRGIVTLEREVNLLVIEDSDADFERIVAALVDEQGVHITRAFSFSEALEKIVDTPFHIVILDYLLPSGNGLEFLADLEKLQIDTPVIFSTGHGDEMIAAQAIQAGAYDYLPKSHLDRPNLLRVIAHTLEKHRLKGEVNQAMEKMADMSVRDDLTGLFNRRYMNELLEREFSRAQRYGNDLSCLLIDMDFFKQINDSYGHIFGDFVLKRFAQHLAENVRESDFCFRYGGEEFLVLLPNTDIEGACNTGEKLRSAVEAYTFRDGETATNATISIGSVSFKEHRPQDVRSMLAFADKALYRAKAEGRNRIKAYLEKSKEHLQEAQSEVDMAYFRERMATILEKTKKASLNSLTLLFDQLGAGKFKAHNRQSTAQIEMMGQKMRLPGAVVETIKRAAMMHDHLKVLLPDSVLGKTGPLNREDRAFIENHATMLAELTRLFEFFRNEREILLYHQERYDGSGYPTGLKGEQIPLGARIFAIADAVTAMMSERPYRPPLTGRQIVDELIANAGTQFDPHLIDIFLDALEENPATALRDDDLVHRVQQREKPVSS